MNNVVWHYTDAYGLMGIVRSRRVWATSPRYLNDTREVDYGLELAAEVLSRKLWTEYEPTVRRSLAGLRLHVSCFSRLGDSLAQWRSYGGQQQGYALAFSTADSFGCSAYYPYVGEDMGKPASHFAPTGANWHEVVYNKEDQVAELVAWRDERLPEYTNGRRVMPDELLTLEISPKMPPEVLRHWAASDLARQIARLKSPGFAEEQEVRLVWSAGSPERSEHLSFRPTRRGIASYVELRALRSDGSLPLRGFRVGPGPDQETALLGLTEFLTANHTPKEVIAEVQTSTIPFR